MFSLGGYNASKAKGLALWRQFGYGAPRRHAALRYAGPLRSVSPEWDWAAACLFLHAPDPPSGAPPYDVDLSAHASASEPPPPLPSVGPDTGIVDFRGETPSPTFPSPAPSDSASSSVPAGMDEIRIGCWEYFSDDLPSCWSHARERTFAKDFVGRPLSLRRMRWIRSPATDPRKPDAPQNEAGVAKVLPPLRRINRGLVRGRNIGACGAPRQGAASERVGKMMFFSQMDFFPPGAGSFPASLA